MNNNKKKITTVVLLLAFLAIAVTGGTLAYFTDTDDATNTFTVGNVDIILSETAWNPAETQNVYPGEVLKKNPTVTNNGNNPCYVRIKVTNLDQFVTSFGSGAMITYRTNNLDGKLGDNWVVGADGYFYYTKELPVYDGSSSNHVTEALFEEIVIPKELTNNVAAQDIVVFAEAIQSEGFTDYTAAFTAYDAL